ncbi:MAG: hypothetical protein ACK5HY_11055, partial [Parahaliea sp.]
MISDLASTAGRAPVQLDCDVCIAGAGPAGIALALTLARARPDRTFVLLEAGGRETASGAERDIYRVGQDGRNYSVLDISRRRMLGGTTAHWGGWCRPLDPTDFEEHPAWDQPGWPLAAEELAPYYRRAARWCELGSDRFDPSELVAGHPRAMLHTTRLQGIDNRLFRFSPPTRFGKRYAADIESQANLHCYLHANLTAIERAGGQGGGPGGPGGQRGERIGRVQARALEGGALSVSARHFVLALGGMESTRYLLNMRERDGKVGGKGDERSGTGIHSPHLGRYFADHFGLTPAHLLAPAELQYHLFADQDRRVMPVLAFDSDTLRREQQNNTCIRLYAVAADPVPGPAYLRQGALGFSVPGPGSDYWQYEVKLTVEPRPNPASRLRLTDERCALGLHRLALSWQLDDRDFASAFALVERLAQQLGATGLGRLRFLQTLAQAQGEQVSAGCHHMGTA